MTHINLLSTRGADDTSQAESATDLTPHDQNNNPCHGSMTQQLPLGNLPSYRFKKVRQLQQPDELTITLLE